MSPNRLSHLAVASLFLGLTLALTFPLVLHLSDAVRDPGDPLFNSWILSWNVRQLSHGDLAHFFDANIFFPNQGTLAYSEMLAPQTLVAAVPLLISENPILAHNLVMLFSFFTTGFCMYLFARRLSHSSLGGLVAGITFAFSPFMFSHLSHVQILFAGGFPLCFLFLDRFFRHERLRDALLAALCLAVQMLANSYYAVYLAYACAVTVLYHLIAARRALSAGVLLKGLAAAGVVLLVVGPIFYQYFAFRHETGFARTILNQAELKSYIAAPEHHLLYGRLTAGEDFGERQLCLGLLPLTLALVAVFRWLKKARRRNAAALRKWQITLSSRLVFGVLAALLGLIIGVTLFSGGMKLSSSTLGRPAFLLFLVVCLRAVVEGRFRRSFLLPLTTGAAWVRYFSGFLLVSFLLSFGSIGPYELLYRHAPGFDALRAVARIHILTLFCLSVLAAFGVRSLLARAPAARRLSLGCLLLVLLTVEHLAVPLPLEEAPDRDALPAVYGWLASQPRPAPTLELPLQEGHRRPCERTYFSTMHWQPMVDGYSGYIPPFYEELRWRWRNLPSIQTLSDARQLGVRYVILHRDQLSKREHSVWRRLAPESLDWMRRVATFGEDEVWELAALSETAPVPEKPAGERLAGEPLDRAGFSVNANPSLGARRIFDGDLTTHWQTGPQTGDEDLRVDLGATRWITGVWFTPGPQTLYLPRGYVVEVSLDGEQWQRVAESPAPVLPIRSFLRPREVAIEIPIPATEARHVRVANLGKDRRRPWRVAELAIWGRPVGGKLAR